MSTARINWKKVTLFYGGTFAVTHAITIGYWLSGGSWSSLDSVFVANLCMLVPATVAIALQKLVYREPLVPSLGLRFRPNGWFLIAWLLAFLMTLATVGLGLLLPGAVYTPELSGLAERYPAEQVRGVLEMARAGPGSPVVALTLQSLVAGTTLSAVAGFGEEAGWRGLLFQELSPLGFWRYSAITGLLWGLWHVPAMLMGYQYPGQPIAGALIIVATTLVRAPLYTYLRLRSQSVIAVSIFHGVGGASSLIPLAALAGVSNVAVGLVSLVPPLVLNVALWAYARRLTPVPAH